MARIAGIDIPRDKRIVVALQYIYGIGNTTAENICKAADVSVDIRTKDLTEEQEGRIRQEVAKYKVEGDLRREVALNIKRLMEIGCIVEDYQFVDKIQETIHVLVRDLDIQSLTRRKQTKEVNNNGKCFKTSY